MTLFSEASGGHETGIAGIIIGLSAIVVTFYRTRRTENRKDNDRERAANRKDNAQVLRRVDRNNRMLRVSYKRINRLETESRQLKEESAEMRTQLIECERKHALKDGQYQELMKTHNECLENHFKTERAFKDLESTVTEMRKDLDKKANG